MCRGCRKTYRDEFFIKQRPCGCETCSHCGLRLLANRGDDEQLDCIICGNETMGFTAKVPTNSTGVSTRHKIRRGTKRSYDDLVVDYTEPAVTWRSSGALAYAEELGKLPAKQVKTRLGKDGILLTEQYHFTYDEEEEGNLDAVRVAMSKLSLDKKNPTVDDNEFQNTVSHFAWLHTAIMNHPSNWNIKAADGMTDKQLLDRLEANGEECLMIACMFALVSGYTEMGEFSEKRGHKMKPGELFPPALAAEIILRSAKPHIVGPVVRTTSTLMRHAHPTKFHNFLGKCRAIVSRSAGLRADASRYIARTLHPSTSLMPRDLPMTIQDNINWKRVFGDLSVTGTMLNWTLMVHRQPDEHKIRLEGGFYNDAEPGKRITRKGKLWKEDFLDKLPQIEIIQIFQPSNEDYNNHRELNFLHKRASLEAYSEGLQSKSVFDKALQKQQYSYNTGVPKLERIFDERDYQLFMNIIQQATTGTGIDQNELLYRMWKMNDIVPSMPIDLDFSKKNTVIELMEYLVRISERQAEEFKSIPGHEGMEPPISADFLFFVGDGNPIVTALRIIAEDAAGAGRYSKIRPIFGIFHAFMKVFKRTNRLFEDVLTKLVNLSYSKRHDKEASEKNVSYFLDFNDPIVPEKIIGRILLAINLKATMELKEQRWRNLESVTPQQLHEFMMERGRDSPQDMELFLLSEALTDVLMLRKAERKNNVDLYLSAMKLTLPLLAHTNSDVYVHLFADFIQYWETCSEAECKLIRLYGFTMESSNGARIGLDFGHEKYVRLVRDSTGKVAAHGGKARIEFAGYLRAEIADVIKDVKPTIQGDDYVRGTGQKRTLRDRDIKYLSQIMHQLDLIGAWSNNPVKKVFENDTNALYSVLCGGDRLMTNILHADSVGTRLVDKYVQKFYLRASKPTTRTRLLEKHAFSADELKKRAKKAVLQATNTAPSVIKNAGNKSQLVEQLQKLVPYLDGEVPEIPGTAAGIATLLATLRLTVFVSHPELRQTWEREAADSVYDGASTQTDRVTELERPRYSRKLDGGADLANLRFEL